MGKILKCTIGAFFITIAIVIASMFILYPTLDFLFKYPTVESDYHLLTHILILDLIFLNIYIQLNKIIEE